MSSNDIHRDHIEYEAVKTQPGAYKSDIRQYLSWIYQSVACIIFGVALIHVGCYLIAIWYTNTLNPLECIPLAISAAILVLSLIFLIILCIKRRDFSRSYLLIAAIFVFSAFLFNCYSYNTFYRVFNPDLCTTIIPTSTTTEQSFIDNEALLRHKKHQWFIQQDNKNN